LNRDIFTLKILFIHLPDEHFNNVAKGDKTMIGKVIKWTMTEEERQAYIKKYPIKATEPPKGSTFVSLEAETKANMKKRFGSHGYIEK
jgi:hypothetical protein